MLHTAAKAGNLAVVQYLVEEKRFEMDAITPSGLTAFDLALERNMVAVLTYFRKKMMKTATTYRKLKPDVLY